MQSKKKNAKTNFILLYYLKKSNKYNYIYKNTLSNLCKEILDIRSHKLLV